MRTGILRALLGWLANAFASARSVELPNIPELLGAPRLPDWRKRQMLRPGPGTLIFKNGSTSRADRRRIIALGHLCDCDLPKGKHFEGNKNGRACTRLAPFYAPASSVQNQIAKAIRNAVAVGSRNYQRLSAVARG